MKRELACSCSLGERSLNLFFATAATPATLATSPAVSASMELPESVGFVRDPGGYPPEYVCDAAMGKAVVSSFFSLEIEHNGIFCGASSKLECVLLFVSQL